MRRTLHVQLLPLGPRAGQLTRQRFAVLLSVDADGALPDLGDPEVRRKLLPWHWATGEATGSVAVLRAGEAPDWDSLRFEVLRERPAPPCADQVADDALRALADGWVQVAPSDVEKVPEFARISPRIAGMWGLPGDVPSRLGILYTGELRLVAGGRAPGLGDGIVVVPAWPEVEADRRTFAPLPGDGAWWTRDDPFAPSHTIGYVAAGGVETEAHLRPTTLAMSPGERLRFGPLDDVGGSAAPVDDYWLTLSQAASPDETRDERLWLRAGGALPAPFWHAARGMIVLGRRGKQGPWRALSAARVVLRDEDEGAAWGSFAAPYVCPVRVREREGAAESTVAYGGASLVAEDPIARKLAETFRWYAPEKVEPDPTRRGRYGEAVSKRDGEPTPEGALLPWLLYGEPYEFAAFFIDHGGGGPSLVAGDGPWRFHERVLAGTWEAPESARVSLRFMRKTPVGPVRAWFVRPTDREGRVWGPAPPPPVPDEVEPLCLDFAEASQGADAAEPFALLDGRAGTPTSVTLRVDLPRCSVEVFKHWVGERGALERALSAYYAALIEQGPAPVDDPRDRAVALLDPAVSGFELVVEKLDPASGAWAPMASLLVDRAAWSADEFLGRGDRLIEVRRDENVSDVSITLPPDPAGPIAVVLPRDPAAPSVFRLSFSPRLVPAASERFDKLFKGTQAPCRVRFELPGGELPAPEVLWMAGHIDEQRRVVTTTLEAPAMCAVNHHQPGWLLVSHWAVPRSRWSWRGRAVPRLDGWPEAAREAAVLVDEAPVGVVARHAWLAEMFPGTETNELAWQRVHARNVAVLRDDHSGDLRAQLLRYGLAVRSRYRGLGGAPERVACRPGATEPELRTWALPPKVDATLPDLRAVIPLTRRSPAALGKGLTADVLVILRGAAFQQAGFTERLVVHRRGPVGRDPLLHGASAAMPDGEVECVVDGPLGHTFDALGAERPLFNASSYVVHVGHDLRPFDFVTIRIARAADGRFQGGQGPGVEHALQVLPASDECPSRPPEKKVGEDLQVAFDLNTLGAFAPVPLRLEGAGDVRRLVPYLLVTARSKDVRGISLETFVDFAPPLDSEGAVRFQWKATQGDLILRLVLVQLVPAAQGGAGGPTPKLAERWLPGVGNDAEVDARVVAVSVPLERPK